MHLQSPDERRVEQEAVGHLENHDVREASGDVQDFQPGEGLHARNHEEGYIQLVRLCHNSARLVSGKPARRVASNSLCAASLASQVAPIGDAEDGDRGNVDSFPRHARTAAGRPALPEHGPGKEERLGGSPQAHAHEL